jgi:DNA-binding NtrC family response regulator
MAEAETEEHSMSESVLLRAKDETYAQAMERLARTMLARALRLHAGDLDKAAADLGMDADHLREEVERLQVAIQAQAGG